MESIVFQRKLSHVFRLPQLAGNSKNTTTLLNFLIDSIENKSLIKILSNAERNNIFHQKVKTTGFQPVSFS